MFLYWRQLTALAFILYSRHLTVMFIAYSPAITTLHLFGLGPVMKSQYGYFFSAHLWSISYNKLWTGLLVMALNLIFLFPVPGPIITLPVHICSQVQSKLHAWFNIIKLLSFDMHFYACISPLVLYIHLLLADDNIRMHLHTSEGFTCPRSQISGSLSRIAPHKHWNL